jgi:hypothetical protein
MWTDKISRVRVNYSYLNSNPRLSKLTYAFHSGPAGREEMQRYDLDGRWEINFFLLMRSRSIDLCFFVFFFFFFCAVMTARNTQKESRGILSIWPVGQKLRKIFFGLFSLFFFFFPPHGNTLPR